MNRNLRTTFFLFFLLSLSYSSVMGQKEWSVYGKILSKDNGKALSSITVTNQRNNHVVVSNSSGDFYIRAAEGDSLIISGIGYGRVSIFWNKQLGNPVIELKQEAIILGEVVVKDKRSETIEREIKAFLDNPHNAATMKRNIVGDLVRTSASGGLGGGAGLSIDALFDLWSKDGKSKRKAAELEYQDLRQFYIELRYNPRKVANITGLKTPDLEEFMRYCPLNEGFILEASDYALTYEILLCLREFNNTVGFPDLKK